MMRASASEGQRRTLVVGAVMAVAAAPLLLGSPGALLLAGGVLTGVAILLRPRLGIVALLCSVATLFPTRIGAFEVAGIRSDVPEAVAILLIGIWLVRIGSVRGHPTRNPLAGPLLLIVAAAVLGSIVAMSGGATVSAVLGPLKTFVFWLVPLPLLAELRRPADLEWLQRLVLTLAIASAVVTIVLVMVGAGVPHAETTEVVTTGVRAEAQRIRPAALQIQFLGTLLLMHRATFAGWTAYRIAGLVVVLMAQALSFNRSTWIALVAVSIIYGLRRPGPRVGTRGLRTGMIGASALAVALLLGSAGVLGPTGRALAARAASTANPLVFQERSQSLRNEESRIARAAIARRPVTGVGLDQPYGSRRGRYSEQLRGRVYSDHLVLHNTFLKIWLDLGLAGVIGFVLLGGRVVKLARGRHRLQPMSSSLVLASILSVLGFALQAAYQTKLYHRPSIVTIGVALSLAVAATQMDNRDSAAEAFEMADGQK